MLYKNMEKEQKISQWLSNDLECWAHFQFQSITQHFVSLPERLLTTYHCVCQPYWGRGGKEENVQNRETLDRSDWVLCKF